MKLTSVNVVVSLQGSPEVAERFAEGLLKAGLPDGYLPGYYKAFEENRLTGEAIRELVFGRKRTEWIGSGIKGVQDPTKDGKITLKGALDFEIDTGKGWIEGDMLCCNWKRRYNGLKYCLTVFRNPEEHPELNDEYVAVTDLGGFPFSLND